MIINRWMGTQVDYLPGITQEARPQSEWPYPQDWIVSRIKWDSGNRCYWIEGHLLRGQPFYWGQSHKLRIEDGIGYIRLDWRFDLTNATYETGRHETRQEAETRHWKEIRQTTVA